MKNHKVPARLKVVKVGGSKVPVTTVKVVRFSEEQVRLVSSGAIAYLRGRYDVKRGKVVFSLRNQKGGKGRMIIKGREYRIARAGVARDAVFKLMPFYVVHYEPYMEFKKRVPA